MKRRIHILALLGFLLVHSSSNAQIITTVAGNGAWGYSGDGIPATTSELYGPNAVAVDAAGNLYIADMINNRVRKVDATGIITTFAGNGYTTGSVTGAYSGDGGPADSAELYWPASLAFDAAGNLYIADAGNNRIRKVNTAGIISTYAGTDSAGYNGDGIAATTAYLHYPEGICVDGNGNLYIADAFNNRIRKVDTAGIITTIAGDGYGAATYGGGYGGDGGPAIAAQLHWPGDVAIDNNGNVYIADVNNNCIRKADTMGVITTIAGNDTVAGYNGDSIIATTARLCSPSALIIDVAGNIYIGDGGNDRVRIITTDGYINTFAGNGYGGYSGDGGLCTDAELFSPNGMAFDAAGDMYIADEANYLVRQVAAVPNMVSKSPLLAGISVHPNPATKEITISLPPAAETSAITIYDCYGRQVVSRTTAANAKSISFDVTNIARGSCLVRVVTNGQYYSQTIILE